MKLYEGRLDACLLLGSIQKNRLVNIYSKTFKRFSNVECPLKAVSVDITNDIITL